MRLRLAAPLLFIVLPLALHAQTIWVPADPSGSLRGAVLADIDAGQRDMQREQEMEDRRSKQEFDRQEQLERIEQQRQLDRHQRQVEQQRRQLLHAQRAATQQSQNPTTRGTSEARQQPSNAKVQ